MKIALLLFISCLVSFSATVNVAHYDISQMGVNTTEVSLTPTNVSKIHKVGAWRVTGTIFTQPLYIPNVNGKNLLIVTTTSATIYALDADVSGSIVWSHVLTTTPRVTYPKNSGTYAFAYGGPIGIMSTPFVDVANSFIYVVSENESPSYTIWKLNLADGTTVNSALVAGTVTGTGDPSGGDCVSGSVLSFCASLSFINRPALVVANGNVYMAFGSADIPPYHGFIIGYSTSTLTLTGIWCTTPNGDGGSIWMSGAAPAVDAGGNLYILTGNGDYDGVTSFSESVVKLSPTLSLLDWFTPSNWSSLNDSDSDVSANHFTLIPGITKGMYAAKDYNAYVLNTTCMGHLGGAVGGCTQQAWLVCGGCEVGKSTGGYNQILLNGVWYLPTSGEDADSFGGAPAGSIYAYSETGGTFNTTPVASLVGTWPFPGAAQIAGSSNGATNQIIWVTTPNTQTFNALATGTVRALNTSLSELWNSGSGPDALGYIVKYTAPVVSDGRVYIPTQDGQVVAYGLNSAGSSLGGLSTLTGASTLK